MKKLRMSMFVLMGIILLIAPLLSACGEEAARPETGAEGGPQGTFVFAVASLGSEGFVPWLTFLADYLVYGAVYDPIALSTPEGQKIPCAAERWEWSKDFLDLTIYLREGIQFQDDWGELTADDVVYLLEQTMGPNSPSGAKSYMDGLIEDIDVIDPYTIVIHQNEPKVDYADFYAFSPIYASVPCKKYIETVGVDEAMITPIGSGPYKLVEKKTGNYLRYEAVEDHWRVVPEFKYLIIRQVAEESTRVAMLKTNVIDATCIGPTSIADLPEEDFTMDIWPYGPNSDIVFGGLARPGTPFYKEGYHNQDPWADIRVREAMNIAIDRDAINKALHLGTAEPARLVHTIPGYNEVEPIPYDPERAKELLEEAGYPDGFSFTLVSSPFHPGVPMVAKEAEAVVGYWAEIGIEAEINPLDFPAYNPKVVALENVGECFTYRLTYGGANPFSYLMQLNNQDPHWGGRWQCEASDILTPMAQAALAELDLTKRTEMYKEIAEVERENWIGIPLILVPYIIAKNKHTVGDWPPNSSSYYWNFEYIRHAEPLNTFRLFEIDID